MRRMSRRSTPQKQIDDRAFPVRVYVRVPAGGFENLLPEMHRWLDGVDRPWRLCCARRRLRLIEATAWYFRTIEDAQTFVAKFLDARTG